MSATLSERARRAVTVAAVLAVAIETACAFLPWVRTGRRDRTSFELISAARELDVLRSPLERVAATAWYLMPLLAALVALTAALAARRAMGLMAITTGFLGLAIGRGVLVAPFAYYAPLVICTIASGFAVIAGLLLLVTTRE